MTNEFLTAVNFLYKRKPPHLLRGFEVEDTIICRLDFPPPHSRYT
jgi:hypothetical protein